MSTIWVFGYGSLIWIPGFAHDARVVGFVRDYRRIFYRETNVGGSNRICSTMERGKLKPGGLSDPRLGTIGRKIKCETCMAECPGGQATLGTLSLPGRCSTSDSLGPCSPSCAVFALTAPRSSRMRPDEAARYAVNRGDMPEGQSISAAKYVRTGLTLFSQWATIALALLNSTVFKIITCS